MTPSERYRVQNREYYKLYMRRYRALRRGGRPPEMDTCPSCGHRKQVVNDLCKKCSEGSIRVVVKRGSLVHHLGCVVCQQPMTEFHWHGQRMYRCSGCGLELKNPTVFVKEAA